MIRYRNIVEVKYGHFAEALATYEELNEVIKRQGMTPGIFFVPIAGRLNELICEVDYPDLARYETENNQFYSDPECMKVLGRLVELLVQGSSREEMFQAAPKMA